MEVQNQWLSNGIELNFLEEGCLYCHMTPNLIT
jgi:hypothetical protein